MEQKGLQGMGMLKTKSAMKYHNLKQIPIHYNCWRAGTASEVRTHIFEEGKEKKHCRKKFYACK